MNVVKAAALVGISVALFAAATTAGPRGRRTLSPRRTRCPASPSTAEPGLERVQIGNTVFYQIQVDGGRLAAGTYFLAVDKKDHCEVISGDFKIPKEVVFEKGDLLKIVRVKPAGRTALLGTWDGLWEQVGTQMETGEKTKDLGECWIEFHEDGTYRSKRHSFEEAGKYKIEGDKVSLYEDEKQLAFPGSYVSGTFAVDHDTLKMVLPKWPMTIMYKRRAAAKPVNASPTREAASIAR